MAPWLYKREGSKVVVYTVPSLLEFRAFAPSFGPNFRFGLSGDRLYFASFDPKSYHTYADTYKSHQKSQLEVYDILSGQLVERKAVACICNKEWPLVITDSELIDVTGGPQAINLKTGTTRKVMLDMDVFYGWEKLTGCYHNGTLVLVTSDRSRLEVFESTLGNYSPTLSVPPHLRLRKFRSPAVVAVAPENILIYAYSELSPPLLYNTKIKCAEVCGDLPWKHAKVASHVVHKEMLYALLQSEQAMICDLQTGIAMFFSLKKWNEIKGLLWAHLKGLLVVPVNVLKAITQELFEESEIAE